MSICCIFNSRFFLSLVKILTMKTTLLFLSVFLSANLFGQQMTFVPDDFFEQKLIDLGYDDVLDDSVLTDNISVLTELVLWNSYISDLTGIQDFVSLVSLDCSSNQLTSLDVSENTALVELSCNTQEITSLDVSQNTALKVLRCNNLLLTNLELSSNSELEVLSCYYNTLTSLDVSQNSNLTNLNCKQNLLNCLNLKNGNNSNMLVTVYTNTNLTCIEVDDVSYSNANWTAVDSQTYFSTNCNNDCSNTSSINELTTSKNLIQILDMMGRESLFKPNTPLIYVYDDGSTEKVFSVEY